MPRGRGRGGHRKMFFLQSCLLLLLHREPGYGYSLMEGLSEFGFNSDQMDISTIYRALRNLQVNNLVSDSWDDQSLGPNRRVYTITPTGEAALSEWIETLQQRRKEIEKLEAAYAEIKANPE
ncbi:PadR family transcriptional regulator [Chloroflexota bacterium]